MATQGDELLGTCLDPSELKTAAAKQCVELLLEFPG
jgi:hypothetical protein